MPKLTQYGDYATWLTFDVMANYCIRIIITPDLTNSAMGRLGHSPADGAADAFCYHLKGEGKTYLFLPLDAPVGTIVHECWHCIYRMFNWCGVQDFDDETVAYHLDHIVEKVYEFKKAIQSAPRKENSNAKQSKRRTKSSTASAGRNR